MDLLLRSECKRFFQRDCPIAFPKKTASFYDEYKYFSGTVEIKRNQKPEYEFKIPSGNESSKLITTKSKLEKLFEVNIDKGVQEFNFLLFNNNKLERDLKA